MAALNEVQKCKRLVQLFKVAVRRGADNALNAHRKLCATDPLNGAELHDELQQRHKWLQDQLIAAGRGRCLLLWCDGPEVLL